MSQLNDISLVAQVVVFQNTKAFDRLVKKYQSSVRQFFLHQTCGDSELSETWHKIRLSKLYKHRFVQESIQFLDLALPYCL